MIKLDNILVATDFGEASETALNYGRSLARTFGGTLHVLHVTKSAFVLTGPEAVGLNPVALQARIDNQAMDQLQSIIRDDDRRDLRAKLVIRSGTTPAYEIVSQARLAKIDLIVIGTHGRGAMAHLFMGSVAERVVRAAPCPVLTVRHPEHEFVFPDALQVVAHRDA
jgi:nucleotide-binding universal stress UspA family protein